MESIVLVIHVLLAIGLITLVLLQHGKGADAGAAFGSGASGTVFGASGSGSFLTKLTTWTAIAFFATSLGLAYISANTGTVSSVFDVVAEEQPAVEAPALGDAPVVEEPVEAPVADEPPAAPAE